MGALNHQTMGGLSLPYPHYLKSLRIPYYLWWFSWGMVYEIVIPTLRTVENPGIFWGSPRSTRRWCVSSQAPACRPGLWEPGGSCLDGFSMEFVVLGPAKRRNERHDEGYTYLILFIRKQRCRSNHPFENPPYISELSLDWAKYAKSPFSPIFRI